MLTSRRARRPLHLRHLGLATACRPGTRPSLDAADAVEVFLATSRKSAPGRAALLTSTRSSPILQRRRRGSPRRPVPTSQRTSAPRRVPYLLPRPAAHPRPYRDDTRALARKRCDCEPMPLAPPVTIATLFIASNSYGIRTLPPRLTGQRGTDWMSAMSDIATRLAPRPSETSALSQVHPPQTLRRLELWQVSRRIPHERGPAYRVRSRASARPSLSRLPRESPN